MSSTIMGKAPKSTSGTPEWWQDLSKESLGQATEAARIGYVPYQGADVAAFTPQQINGMQQSADWSAAFNTPGQAAPSVAASLPVAQDFGGGLKGYSSYSGFQDQMAKLQSKYPGLAKYLNSFTVDPVTGLMPTGPRAGALAGIDTSTGLPIVPPIVPVVNTGKKKKIKGFIQPSRYETWPNRR